MKAPIILLFTVTGMLSQNIWCQVNNSIGTWPPFTKWYQNPLGVSPLALHTGSGIIVPGLLAGAILVLSKKDSTLIDRFSKFDDLGYSKGYYGSFSHVFHNNVGINYALRKYMSVGVECTQIFISDKVNRVFGIGFRPFVRFYPVNTSRFKLYLSSGAGLVYFFDQFPKPSGFFGDHREGTKINGCPKYGISGEISIRSNLNFHIGLWHIHFSNGDHPSMDRNPGHDSNGFSVGLVIKPHRSVSK